MKELRMWCYKVLPLVYDDSLSYYEVLCKLKAKINELVGVIDDIPEAVKAYLNTDDFKAYIAQLVDTLKSGFVSVDDYGAKGDGETNDYQAFYDAAEVANELGLPLIADGTKSYAVAVGDNSPITVRTDMNLNGATIVVKDTHGEKRMFMIDQEDFTTETVTQDFFTNDRVYDSKYYGKCIWIKAPIYYSVRPGFDNLTYHEQLLTTDMHGFFTNARYIPTIVNGEYQIKYKTVDVKPITIENIVFQYSDAYACRVIDANRCHLTVRNISFFGKSTFVGDGHTSQMGFFYCYDLVVDGIRGNNIYPHQNSGYLIGLYVVSDYVIRNVKTHLPTGTSWPCIGTSFICNGMYENCQTNRIEGHYSMVGHMVIKGCELHSMGMPGGWGTWSAEGVTIVKDPDRDTAHAAIEMNTNNRLPMNGIISFKDITFMDSCKQFRYNKNYPVDTPQYFNLGKCLMIIDGVVSTVPTSQEILQVDFYNDAEGDNLDIVIKNSDYTNIEQATITGLGDGFNSLTIDNCKFNKLTLSHNSKNTLVKNCEIYTEIIGYPSYRLRGNVVVDSCVFTSDDHGFNIGRAESVENMVVKNCFIKFDYFPVISGVTNAKLFVNNILTGETHNSYESWNSGYTDMT